MGAKALLRLGHAGRGVQKPQASTRDRRHAPLKRTTFDVMQPPSAALDVPIPDSGSEDNLYTQYILQRAEGEHVFPTDDKKMRSPRSP